MKTIVALDVSGLPTFGFGHRSPMWWGTLGMIAAEGMGFAIAAALYLYLAFVARQWPIAVPPPDPLPGTVMLGVLLLSCIPNAMIDRAARRFDLRRVQALLVLMTAVGVLAVGIRAWEFAHIAVRWDTNAYGSAVWFLLGLHFTHLLTDGADTAVLAVLMFTRAVSGKRFSDVSDNAFYWYFVVAAWAVLYLLIYWFPRLGTPT